LKEQHHGKVEQHKAKMQALQDQLALRNDDYTQDGENFTKYMAESQPLSPGFFVRQKQTPHHTYTPRSSWKEARPTPMLRSSWRESRGYEQQPFKAVPNPLLKETMKDKP